MAQQYTDKIVARPTWFTVLVVAEEGCGSDHPETRRIHLTAADASEADALARREWKRLWCIEAEYRCPAPTPWTEDEAPDVADTVIFEGILHPAGPISGFRLRPAQGEKTQSSNRPPSPRRITKFVDRIAYTPTQAREAHARIEAAAGLTPRSKAAFKANVTRRVVAA